MLRVAQFPWDPAPPKQEPASSSNVKPEPRSLPSNGTTGGAAPLQPPLNTYPPMKSERPNYPPQPPPQPYSPPSFPDGQPVSAAQRAAMNLHNRYGDRAGESIAQVQQGGQRYPMPQEGRPQGNYVKSEDSKELKSELKSEPNSADNYSGNSTYPQSSIKAEQIDGAGGDYEDWKTEYARRKALVRDGRAKNDRTIRDQVLASQRQMEGGGLLLPLDERAGLSRPPLKVEESKSSSLSRAQGDAPGDDDDDDEDKEEDDVDAINSDLDDPDDDNGLGETDEVTDQVMLCTYDKVQRVKNKWKCTLKDGILRVDNNE